MNNQSVNWYIKDNPESLTHRNQTQEEVAARAAKIRRLADLLARNTKVAEQVDFLTEPAAAPTETYAGRKIKRLTDFFTRNGRFVLGEGVMISEGYIPSIVNMIIE